jgi:hypothetical protein
MLSTDEAADRLGMSLSNVRRLFNLGRLRGEREMPSRSFGRGRILIDAASVDQLESERAAAGARRRRKTGDGR